MSVDESKRDIQVLCFSKDRAFQCKEFLRSLKTFCLELDPANSRKQPFGGPNLNVSVSIIVSCSSNGHRAAYARLRESFPWVTFFDESTVGCRFPFAKLLLQVLRLRASNESLFFVSDFPSQSASSTTKNVSSPNPPPELVLLPDNGSDLSDSYVLFAVDDLIFHHQFSLAPLVDFILQHNLWCYQTALHPSVSFSHPANQAARRPLFSLESSVGCIFRPSSGTKDWNYPFNLCGGLYRLADVHEILKEIQEKYGLAGLNHPNILEVRGNVCTVSSVSRYAQCSASACSPTPCCCVVTVNRVQDVYRNRVYAVDGRDTSPDALNELFWAGAEFDLEAYQRIESSSVHVGDFLLKSPP